MLDIVIVQSIMLSVELSCGYGKGFVFYLIKCIRIAFVLNVQLLFNLVNNMQSASETKLKRINIPESENLILKHLSHGNRCLTQARKLLDVEVTAT